MTIQLTAPILIAGVHQASGTSLTLGADVEAELVNRGVAIYTSAPVVIRQDIPLVFDDDGNLIANVSHRTGTLSNLLALAGGDGEFSKATDVDAIVVHNGVAGQAKAFYRSAKLGELWLVGSVASLTGGTASVVDWTAKTVDYGGSTVDLANNKFRAPLGTKFVRMTMQVELSDADITANTRLQAFVDFWLGAPFTWSSDISIYILDAETRIAANPDKAVILGFNTADQGTPINNRTSADHGYMRIRLLHSDATDVYTGVTVSAAFEFFG